ncbi:MAG: N-acetyl-gamma-glutamyl-phosphate reductase [Anaerotardibacter sp.]
MGLKVGIVGAAGYAGAELVRLLSRHPEFDLVCVTSNSDKGQKVTDLYPALLDVCDLTFESHDTENLAKCDIVFMATPHTVAMDMVPNLLKRYTAVFDLSADYRLDDVETFEQWYAPHTSPELLEIRAFGLPELFPHDLHQMKHTYDSGYETLVACAGCYPTATSLAAMPAIDLTEGVVVVDAISGITGAGRTPSARTHFCSGNENFEAYGVSSHRHTPEIEQILGLKDRLVFTPHLAPASRGLLSTVTMRLTDEAFEKYSLEDIHARYVEKYNENSCPFVKVLPLGQQPKTSSVVGTNFAHIGLAMHKPTKSLIATCAIDNLLKGAAGQALQCANLVCGFPQTLGLEATGTAI